MKSIVSIVLLALLCSCQTPTSSEPTEPNAPASGEPSASPAVEPTSQELVAYAESYQTYQAINSELKPSNIHGSQVKTFIDKTGIENYQNKTFPYPEGTVSIKESFDSKGELNRLYIMKKIEGYDPEHNDWYYGVMSPEGVASKSGRLSSCISCHEGAKDKDYLFGFDN